MKPLLGIEAAASLLSISPWTVRARIRQGKLKPVRIGRRVLLEQGEIERFVSEARTNTDRLPHERSTEEGQ